MINGKMCVGTLRICNSTSPAKKTSPYRGLLALGAFTLPDAILV